ncbi:MAG TPA: hypothetical protein VJL35_15240 [Gemmatimonadaceae bacterium]|nr:hypothetical protein [Gemmatimonadaceae bacterium]
MRRDKPKLTALWQSLDEAAFGSERTLNLRESLPTAAEARARADAWLRSRQVIKAEEVLIITGRGNQSVGGVGVIRKELLAMMPGLRRRGVVESWREHSPGSIVVKLAPTTALFTAPKRRRGNDEEQAPRKITSLTGLNRDTMLLLRQLALINLETLGVDPDEDFVRSEMERSYSILVKAIPEVDRTETTLMQAVKNAIEDASGGATPRGSAG